MQIYPNAREHREKVEEAIRRFGHCPEHNPDHYFYTADPYDASAVVVFPDGTALLTMREGKAWEVQVEPLAPEERKVPMLVEYISAMLADPHVSKVKLELYGRTRRDLLAALPPTLRARAINYSLTWPVFDLAAFDPAIPGGHYKELRNLKNKFTREHRVEVVDARSMAKEELHAMIHRWMQNRPPRDQAFSGMYEAYINAGFVGTTSARVFVVDGAVSGLNAGWAIPNTHSYYAAIGMHDYVHRDLGDLMYLEDLTFLKAAGYAETDFGGSWEGSIPYKLKFGKARLYKSYIFAVGRA